MIATAQGVTKRLVGERGQTLWEFQWKRSKEGNWRGHKPHNDASDVLPKKLGMYEGDGLIEALDNCDSEALDIAAELAEWADAFGVTP